MENTPTHFNIKNWAERKVDQIAQDIKDYIDLGLDFESAVDIVFSCSTLSTTHKMRALSLCDGYRHEHKYTTDPITGRQWCYQCQKYK